VIEVKACWNRKVQAAIRTQLVEGYLEKNGWTHGVYLVGWYVCDRWDHPDFPPTSFLSSDTYEEACEEVSDLASSYDGQGVSAIVKGVCLDCRFPT